MVEAADPLPRVLETSQYEIRSVYKCPVQIKEDGFCLVLASCALLSIYPDTAGVAECVAKNVL
jgi:hypothetical protein